MTLKRSTILIITLMFAVLIGISYLISRQIILDSFSRIEADLALQNMRRAKNALQSETDRIDTLLIDWAWWDDTVEFIRDGSEEYRQSNLVDTIYLEQSLDVIAFFTPDGRMFWGSAFDDASEEMVPIWESLRNHLQPGEPLTMQKDPRAMTRGILKLPERTLLVASRPILNSESTGPVYGTMLMARVLDQDLIETLSERTQLDLEFISAPVETDTETELTVSDGQLSLRSVLTDIYGQPALELSFATPRRIYGQGLTVLRYHLFFLLVTAIAVSLLTLSQLDRRILRRVASLSSQVSRVGTSDTDIRKVSVSGNDELTALGRDINAMLTKLKENELFLEQVKDHLEAGILIVDPKTHAIVDVNPYAARVIGRPRREILGQICHGFVCPAEEGQCPVTAYERDGDLSTRTLIDTAGREIPILKSVSKIFRDGQELLLETFLDISDLEREREERYKLEEQLRHAQKMEAVGTLAGGIAHDFNNLLQIVTGRIEMLLKEEHPQQDLRLRLEEISRATERGRKLVRHLLTFSRRMEPESKLLDLNDTIRQSLEFMRRTLPRMVDLIFEPDPALHKILGDSTQMEQVLLNLISNACDAMPEGGRIVISTENAVLRSQRLGEYMDLKPGRYVILSVSDTGTGLQKEISAHIFEPFFTTKEVGRGTGLGLSTVYGIVKSHDGQISCYSEPGQGTTFKIYLPVAKASPGDAQDSDPLDEQLLVGNETILIVDDEKDILSIGAEMLRNFGYRVLTATSGEQALDILHKRRQQVDLTVLDLGMPGMGGEKCLRLIKEAWPELGVVVASGYSAHPMQKNPRAYDAAAFVSKPYRIDALISEVRKILDGSAA